MKEIRSDQNWTSSRPYSPATSVAGWLYVSGHVPVDQDGHTVGSDGRAQTDQVLRNIELTLEAAGATMRDIVSTTVFLTDIKDIETVDAAYRDVFDSPYPSRTTVQIASLGRPEFRVEISAIARSAGGGPP